MRPPGRSEVENTLRRHEMHEALPAAWFPAIPWKWWKDDSSNRIEAPAWDGACADG